MGAILAAILASSTSMSVLIAVHRYYTVKRIMRAADTAGRAEMIRVLHSADVLTRWAVDAWVRLVDKGETDRMAAYNATSRRRNEEALNLLGQLDRCEHARHEGDSCFDCPNQRSVGNTLMPTGARIGTALGGKPIWMPRRGQRHLPDQWLIAPAAQETDR